MDKVLCVCVCVCVCIYIYICTVWLFFLCFVCCTRWSAVMHKSETEIVLGINQRLGF
jgi:hypothetical protein